MAFISSRGNRMHDACRSVSLMHRDVPAPDKSIRSHLDVIQVVVLFFRDSTRRPGAQLLSTRCRTG
jgi:hypothetical protein